VGALEVFSNLLVVGGTLETGGQPVVSLTDALVTRLLYEIRRILLRDYASKASSRQARAYVIVHASDPCHNSMGPPKYRNPRNPIDV